jgi:hypothetical protein
VDGVRVQHFPVARGPGSVELMDTTQTINNQGVMK